MNLPAATDFPNGSELRSPPVPLILVVSCSAAIVALTRAAADPTDALVVECDPRGVHALAHRWRPFALVLPRSLQEADPATYERIARRYRATIVPIESESASEKQLRRELILAVRAAYY